MDHRITINSYDVWENYVKVDSDAKSMRYKSWPYYEDCIKIFGKDRAIGKHVKGMNDAANSIDKEIDVEEDDLIKIFGKDRAIGKHAKGMNDAANAIDKEIDDEEDVTDTSEKFTKKTEARLGKIAERIGYEHDMSISKEKFMLFWIQ
ncbi:hypothetical protein ACH5RR_037563 [Cinchona calisaya]|uniref:Uncharacterized protein n=1 Tax=Cinchona calisaya TaxID=153742 RepID=A0ABD2Y6K1_9GENT